VNAAQTAAWFTPAQIASVDQLQAEWANRPTGSDDANARWLDTIDDEEFADINARWFQS
jgi:hypothetical protein